jgi:hypothetical protein
LGGAVSNPVPEVDVEQLRLPDLLLLLKSIFIFIDKTCETTVKLKVRLSSALKSSKFVYNTGIVESYKWYIRKVGMVYKEGGKS